MEHDYAALAAINNDLQIQIHQLQTQHTLNINSSLQQQFSHFFSILGYDHNHQLIDYSQFDPHACLQELHSNFPALHKFLSTFTISTGTARNTHKTSEKKLIGALYHLSCLCFLRNQKTNYFQTYMALVLQSIGQSKTSLSFQNTIGNTVSYYTSKELLDTRAQDFYHLLTTKCPLNYPVCLSWDNWVFRDSIKHQRLNCTAHLVHSTVRAIIPLSTPSTNLPITDFVFPTQQIQDLTFTFFNCDSADVNIQHTMLLWILSRQAKSLLPFTTHKHKFQHSPTQLKCISAPMLFENETSNDGTNVILDDFTKICDIRTSDRAAYISQLCNYLQQVIPHDDTHALELLADLRAQYSDNNISNPARLFAIGAGDCVTYMRANDNAQMGYGAEAYYTVLNYTASKRPPVLMTLGMFHIIWHYQKSIHQIYWGFGYQSMAALVKHSWIGVAAKLYQPSSECFQMIYNAAWAALLTSFIKQHALQVYIYSLTHSSIFFSFFKILFN